MFFRLLCLLLVTLPCVQPAIGAVAQTYRFDISPDLYGRVKRTDPEAVFSPGVITIHAKRDNRRLIRVESDELTLDLHDGRPVANIHQLPYDEQSVVMFEDVNFDGVKDLAIMDGQNSCYHGPSFQIYLGNPRDPTAFTYSAEFTELAQDYCGMFEVDTAKHQLHTMTKSGCCWHQFSSFDIVNGLPRPIHVLEEEYTASGLIVDTESTWNGSRMMERKSVNYALEDGPGDVIFAFEAAGRNARVVIFSPSGNRLAYALLQHDGKSFKTEFAYPEAQDLLREVPRQAPFQYQQAGPEQTLNFSTHAAQYTVYHNTQTGDAGIRIRRGNKQADWKATPGTLEGHLGDVAGEEYDNVAGTTPDHPAP